MHRQCRFLVSVCGTDYLAWQIIFILVQPHGVLSLSLSTGNAAHLRGSCHQLQESLIACVSAISFKEPVNASFVSTFLGRKQEPKTRPAGGVKNTSHSLVQEKGPSFRKLSFNSLKCNYTSFPASINECSMDVVQRSRCVNSSQSRPCRDSRTERGIIL